MHKPGTSHQRACGRVQAAGLTKWKLVAGSFVVSRERYQSRNVLVVEDNVDDVRLLLIAVEAGPEAVAFHLVQDGEQALAYLKGEGEYADRHAHPFPGLVLLDLSLPGMSGFDVLTWIRAQPELSALKVFVWTDAGDPATLERATKAGANRFVPKSVAFVRGGLAGLVGGISEAIKVTPMKENATVMTS
jgi:CheY-like chemotaxis protein